MTNPIRRGALATTILAGAMFAAAAAAQITPGNLVVLRIGDGTAPLTNAATAAFLDEYTTAGALVHTYALPTAVNGANQPLTNSGTATSEGNLTLSPNGQFLVCAGYGAAPGLAGVAATSSATTPRVIARINLAGTIDTSTSLTSAFSGNNIRSATTVDGVQFWAAGATGGIQYTTLGTSTTVALNTALPLNTRVVNIFNGQLYCSSSSGAFQGVSTVGSGLPTVAGQTPALLSGFPTAAGPSNYDFFFADANTLYVADDRTNGSGGIQKWTQAAGVWTLQYTLSPATGIGCRGLSGAVSGGIATLYATTTTTSANQIVSVIDLGATSTFSTVALAAGSTVLRGIRYIKVPGTVSFAGTGSPTTVGIPTIGTANGAPVLGNLSFALTAGNLQPFGIGFLAASVGGLSVPGFSVPGAPATVQIFLNPSLTTLLIADVAGNASTGFGIPLVPAYFGFPIAAQVIAFDGAMPDPLPIGTSVGMQVVIGN